MATQIGDETWYYTNFGDVKDRFAGVLPETDRFKAKRPSELAVSCLARIKSQLEVPALISEYNTLATAPSDIKALIEEIRISPSFAPGLVARGAPIFLLEIAKHILGSDASAFRDQYNAIMRSYYTQVIAPALSRAPSSTVVGAPTTHYLNERRLSDATLALTMRSMKLAEEEATEFMNRIGYTGENQLSPTLMNSAFAGVYEEWKGRALSIATELLTPGALMSMIKESHQYYDRITVYRRRTDSAPRLTITTSLSGETSVWKLRYRDKSPYAPIRDYVAAGYKHMAYKIDDRAIVPVVDADDISELMLDLTLPVAETASEIEIDAANTVPLFAQNYGVIFRTEHVERYLTPEGLNASSELGDFIFECPKGSHKDLYSLETISLPVGSTTLETLSYLDHPELYTSCVMHLLGEIYNVDGLGARDYAQYFAAQTLGAVIPYTTETGKIVIQMSDVFEAPNRVIELPKFVGEDTTHYLDKTLIRRFATQYLSVPDSVLSDTSMTLVGTSLLDYYIRILNILGFAEIAAEIKSKASFTRDSINTIMSKDMVMTWENSSGYANRLKALGTFSTGDLRYKLAMLQVFTSRITNDAVLRAFLHAMSIYLTFDTTNYSSKDVNAIWQGSLKSALL